VLDDEDMRKKCYELVEEAQGRTRMAVEEKKKELRRLGKPQIVDEDDPAKFKHAVKVSSINQ